MSDARILYPDFRDETENTRYPFADSATLTSVDGAVKIAQNTFIDAVLYPIGAGPGLHITRIETTPTRVRIVIADAEGTGDYIATYSPQDSSATPLTIVDEYDRPAGCIVADSEKLASFGTQFATYEFNRTATEFAASVIIPTTEPGVRGIKTPKSNLLTKDVWLIGDMGVQLTPVGSDTIRIDIIGEPLYKRALCDGNIDFPPKKYLKTINGVPPDIFGNFIITPLRAQAPDSILRIYHAMNGIIVETVGGPANA